MTADHVFETHASTHARFLFCRLACKQNQTYLIHISKY